MPTYLSSVSDRESQINWVSSLTKSYYQDDQQAKFIHLRAEVDSLLQQLESLKHQRLVTISEKE